jgi:hypothetical protein
MKSFIAPLYTFTPGASGVGTVNLSGISGFDIKYLVSIINQTKGELIYSTASTSLRYTNVTGTTVTLFKDTSSMSSGDVLQVIYEVQSALLPTGAATEAKQDTGNSSLSSIDGQLTTLNSTDFSTSAKQDTGNTSLSSIDGKFTTLNAKDFATSAKQDTSNTLLTSINSSVATIGTTEPAKAQLVGFVDVNGNIDAAKLTENGAIAVGNAVKKFRDGFSDLAQGAGPDSAIWDVIWTNQGSCTVGRAGNAQGASYMKIGMCPITAGSEFEMITKRSFKYPMRFINMLSISQRIVGQELEISLIGVNGSGAVTELTPITDLAISGTVTINGNNATINFASPHNLKTSDRVILVGNTERRLNVGPVSVNVVNITQITVPCTLANGTYTAGGVVRWADPLAYAKNGAGLLYEAVGTTSATFLTRRNGFNTRLLNSTVTTTANSTSVNIADPFNATAMNMVIANQEEFVVIPRTPDSVAAPGVPLKWTQALPDEEVEYKIRIRAKNLDNFTRPVARITGIARTSPTLTTVTTDVAHGLATTDFVQIYGVRDQVNFANLTAQTQVTSIVSPTQFTILIGTTSSTASAGGTVFLNQGSVLAPGVLTQVVQSLSRTNNVLILVGNGSWTGILPGETIHLYGCDATSMGLYDGIYRVLRTNSSQLELESVGANFTSINCGGAVIKRTDYRIHAVSEIEHTRHIVELSNSQGSADVSRSIPVVFGATQSVNIASGNSTVSSSMGAIPSITTDVVSGAITSSAATPIIAPTAGISYQVNIPVTAVTGTNPTLDITIEESDDSGTNWYRVYDFPRITGTGIYRSPHIPFFGNRIRYQQTVGGTTPSFTRGINRLQSAYPALPQRQLIDRTISLTTLNSTTPILLTRDCGNGTQLVVNIGAATTPPQIQLEGSDDFGATWYAIGSPLTAVASSTVQSTVISINAAAVRARVSTIGVGVTIGYVMIKAHD